ncbi:MEP1B [Bugula neritina]|uniref:Metalloendopeptidase n=1 Tax=Bugula neritina TaxID=10212 RepID=A0A7J7KEP4_BUGNE|nr:MEP1B [Bugula neritina]
MSAIDDYHTYTCLRFVQASANDINRVRFQNGAGCSSYVGMIGGAQPINLAPGCRSKGIVIHEMGHAIGFQHEQSRSDRDTFVSLMSQNIQPGVEFNFRRLSTEEVSSYGVSYDYTSVMHYSGLVTPAPTTPAPAVELGTVCADRMPGCQELQGVKELDCISNLLHIHQCVSTCGRC